MLRHYPHLPPAGARVYSKRLLPLPPMLLLLLLWLVACRLLLLLLLLRRFWWTLPAAASATRLHNDPCLGAAFAAGFGAPESLGCSPLPLAAGLAAEALGAGVGAALGACAGAALGACAGAALGVGVGAALGLDLG